MRNQVMGILVLFALVVGFLLGGCGKGEPGDADLLGFVKAEIEKGSSQKANIDDTEAVLKDVDTATLKVTDTKSLEMDGGMYRWIQLTGKMKDGRATVLNAEYRPKDKKMEVTNFQADKKPDK